MANSSHDATALLFVVFVINIIITNIIATYSKRASTSFSLVFFLVMLTIARAIATRAMFLLI
jgi:hypothetical protein